MQRVSEIMSRNARVVAPHETLQRAAQLMDELDVGALPVCDGERLVGMITDRDLTVRGMAAGTGLPSGGGENGIGAAGASGQPRDRTGLRTGRTTPQQDDGGAAGPGGPA